MTSFDPFFDPKKIELENKNRVKKEKEVSDLLKVLSSSEGERVLCRIIKRTKFFDSSWTGNSTTFFNEGMREIGRSILAEINEACPEKLPKIFEKVLKKDIE